MMSEPSCSQLVLYDKSDLCVVCNQKGHGNHFGAITCRACAAFFRRSINSKLMKKCKNRNKCVFLKNGYFNCKKCRLQKCLDVGMTQDNFQFNRDPSFGGEKTRTVIHNVPPTLSTFLGRSNLIIYVAPGEGNRVKNYVDVNFLLESATRILIQGSETPLHSRNRLKILANGHQLIRGKMQKQVKMIKSVKRDDIFCAWEEELSRVAKWLTYFDEFRKLDHELQVELMKSTWRVWTRLEKIAQMAMGRRRNICDKGDFILWDTNEEHWICKPKEVEVDLSWCSKYSVKQLNTFENRHAHPRMEHAIELFQNLDPTQEEMSYMLAQVCFHYVAKRHGGEIARVAERLQESIADDLHDYYVNELNMPNYLGRIAKMMKVNNHVQEDIYLNRARSVVVKVFEIFSIEFSHPEMFIDF